MYKGKAKTIKKYSIKEVDSLIKSIKSKNHNLTEESICQKLGYSTGYIAQLRSREEATGGKEPQVSPKFMDKLRQNFATLQNTTLPQVGELEANLMAIANSLARLENGQHYIRAELRGYGQYQIQLQVGWDQKKFLAAMAKVGMIVAANLQADDLQGNGANDS